MTAIVVGLGLAVALLGALVVGLLRTHADVLRALHELGVGLDQGRGALGPVEVRDPVVRARSGVPEPRLGGSENLGEPIVGRTPSGGTVAVSLTPRPHATILAFLSTGCATCAAFWASFATDVDLPGEGTQLVIVTRGPEHESPAEVAALAPDRIVTVQSSVAWARFGVPGSPYFALVDGGTGRIVGEGSATTWEHVASLLRRAVDDGGVGLSTAESSRRGSVSLDAAAREARIDRDLAAAGITPDHPSLHPSQPAPDSDRTMPPPHVHD